MLSMPDIHLGLQEKEAMHIAIDWLADDIL